MIDALSDVLNSVSLKSSVYFRSDFYAPWGMQVDKGPFAQFHMIVSGNCWVHTTGLEEPNLLSAGDVVVFPFGGAHWLADDPKSMRQPGMDVVQAILQGEPVFTGERLATTLICGHFEFDRDVDHPFLQALPEYIHISATKRHRLSWLETISNVIIQEAGAGSPGSSIVSKRLAEALLIHVLRTHMEQAETSTGYFAALKNRQINTALNIIHDRLEFSWTLELLAKEIGMSRSAFSARFKTLVGITPIGYITNWRMQKAKELMTNQTLSLIDIAEKVGYRSEAAFNRAFKRRFNQNPGVMRRSLRQ
ncbi:MAG: AraC family transcriptional regulator [Calditrichia bacterium]